MSNKHCLEGNSLRIQRMKTTPARSCVSCYGYDDSLKGTVPTPCCGRFVCGLCARRNPRLVETCILCQLPIPHDLRDSLPGYDEYLPGYQPDDDDDTTPRTTDTKSNHEKSPLGYKEIGVQHFVRKEDSVASLSLSYNVPASTIRKANHLFSDTLLQGRSFILVPGATRSLSDRPGEEDVRKGKLKRFMVAVKCTDYDMAKSKSPSRRSFWAECSDTDISP